MGRKRKSPSSFQAIQCVLWLSCRENHLLNRGFNQRKNSKDMGIYFFDTLWCHQTCLAGKSPSQMKVCSWEDHRTPHDIPALRVSSYRFHLSFSWRMSGCSWKILRLWCMWGLSTVPKIQSRETLPKSPKRPWNAVNIMNRWKAKLQKPSPNRHCLYTFCTILYFFYHRKPSNFRICGEMRLPPREFEDFQVLPLPPLERKNHGSFIRCDPLLVTWKEETKNPNLGKMKACQL